MKRFLSQVHSILVFFICFPLKTSVLLFGGISILEQEKFKLYRHLYILWSINLWFRFLATYVQTPAILQKVPLKETSQNCTFFFVFCFLWPHTKLTQIPRKLICYFSYLTNLLFLLFSFSEKEKFAWDKKFGQEKFAATTNSWRTDLFPDSSILCSILSFSFVECV